jgi:Domain of unknown function (DUF4260)
MMTSTTIVRAWQVQQSIVIPDTVRLWLHAEGAAALVAAGITYNALGGNWWLFLPLLLLPDISAVGYMAGPRLGAFTYNIVHNWVVGLATLGLGLWLASDGLLIAGTLLIAHVGLDRMLGYGLKHVTGFKDTHLQRA